ncbi:hypothetical protein C8J57DRAFT_1530690 [Mycena rebaudengoi]|nr:hypothetical protein C8J57DRAFT_1530690 [Mycena rebaudengoi]
MLDQLSFSSRHLSFLLGFVHEPHARAVALARVDAAVPPRTPPPDGEEHSNSDREPARQQQLYSSLARMSSLALVSGALRVYEAGKASSRIVQYTSTLVSTSLRHASSMDEFAGGVLNRVSASLRALLSFIPFSCSRSISCSHPISSMPAYPPHFTSRM